MSKTTQEKKDAAKAAERAEDRADALAEAQAEERAEDRAAALEQSSDHVTPTTPPPDPFLDTDLATLKGDGSIQQFDPFDPAERAGSASKKRAPIGSYEYAKNQGATDEEAARYVIESHDEKRRATEALRPKRCHALSVVRVNETAFSPGTDITDLFSREQLEAFVRDGVAELK